MNYTIRNYRAEDEHDVVALWNRCLPKDEILLNTFRRKVILDPNFDLHGCFVAVAKKQVIGFMLSVRRRYPYYDLGLEEGKGWITVFFVDPEWRKQSVATGLLEHAERFLGTLSVNEISIADYTPNYFIPGVDLDAHADAHTFLKNRGYKKVQSVYGMGRSILDVDLPKDMLDVSRKLDEAGFSIVVFNPAHTIKLLEFLRRHYPGDLFRVALERITDDPECDEVLVALKDDQVVGFSHFLDERFGPFGIAPEFSGRGLGPLLYYHTVLQMRKKGKHNLWLAWTTGKAKDFYHKVDLKVFRRHVIMKKNL